MTTSRQKGNYYARRSKEWLEKQGWVVAKTETSKNCGAFTIRQDLWGSDYMAINGKEIMFIQVKFLADEKDTGSVSHAKAEFNKYPFPKCVKRVVHLWRLRKKEPIIIEVEDIK